MKKITIYKCLTILMIIIAIFAKGKVNATETTEDWNEWQKREYWEWYTRTTTDDEAYNGEHIAIKNDVIDFYGYWQNSYKDFLYKEYQNPGKKIFQFRLDEEKANYHTLDGAGFIFNAKKEDNKLSGYILLFTEKTVNLYKIKNIDINAFETASSKVVADYGELIKSVAKTGSQVHNLRVEATPGNIKVVEASDEILNVNLDYSQHDGESFGLISSYVQHACSILSKIEFSQLKMTLEDFGVNIINTDTEGNMISGGTFEIKDKSGEVVGSGKTDENGMLQIKGLTEGNYTIQQKIEPKGYVLNNKIYNFQIDKDGNVISKEIEEDNNLIIKNEEIKEKIKNETKDNNIENTPKNNTKIDNTKSNKVIPNAGNKIITIVILMLLGVVISTFLIIKLNEYRDIK